MGLNTFDFDVDGLTKNDGSPLYYENDDAIKNSFSLWLTSKKGDFLKNPGAGGVMDYFLFKSLKKDNLDLLGFTLQNEITLGWKDILNLTAIKIIPSFQDRLIEVEVTYTIIESGEKDQVVLFLDKSVGKVDYDYQSVVYTGENLYNFVNIQKNSYKNEKLVYSTDLSCWVWGQFKLINLTEDDPYFDDILAVINTA